MKRTLLAGAVLAALTIAPAPAVAAETAYVASGVLTYTSTLGQVDAVTIGVSGSGHYVRDSISPSGAPGPGCAAVPNESYAVCTGATSADLKTLDGNDFVYLLNALPSTVDAGPGDDEVWGGTGADALTGGPGLDRLNGGFGDDRIYADDGFKDTIDCGAGDDRAVTDASDVVTNCEADPVVVDPVVVEPVVEEPVVEKTKPAAKVDKPEKPSVPVVEVVEAELPAVESPLPPVSPVSLVEGPVQVVNGSALILLGCAATEVTGCVGDVFLDPASASLVKNGVGNGKGKGAEQRAEGKDKKAKKAKVRALASRRGRFGKSPFQIAAGKSKNLQVRLSPVARRKLGLPTGKRARAARRGRRVKAVVSVVQRGKKAQRSVVELRG